MKEKLINLIKSSGRKKLAEWMGFYKNIFYGYGYSSFTISDNENNFLVKLEDHHGGEGMGEEYWSVFCVEYNGNKSYFKIDGWYQSYDGAEMNGDHFDFYEVEKAPVQTYEWKKVNKKT